MRDPDVRRTQSDIDTHVAHEAEMSDSDEEDGRRDVTIPVSERPPIDTNPIPPIKETLSQIDNSSVHSSVAQPTFPNQPKQPEKPKEEPLKTPMIPPAVVPVPQASPSINQNTTTEVKQNNNVTESNNSLVKSSETVSSIPEKKDSDGDFEMGDAETTTSETKTDAVNSVNPAPQ